MIAHARPKEPKTKVRLFVGGVVDGYSLTIPADFTVIEVPAIQPEPVAPAIPGRPPHEFRNEAYREMKFRGERKAVAVMAHGDLTADDVLAMLIDNYLPEREPANA